MRAENIERADLVVCSKSGVLGRVAGHIRREGWNIKRLTADELKNRSALSALP
jgi:acetolactate synthase small subunit